MPLASYAVGLTNNMVPVKLCNFFFSLKQREIPKLYHPRKCLMEFGEAPMVSERVVCLLFAPSIDLLQEKNVTRSLAYHCMSRPSGHGS